jgi:MFS family permease
VFTRLLADIAAAGRAKLWRGAARLTIAMSLVAIAMAALAGGLIFGFLGLYVSLAEVMPSWQAGVIVGSGLLFLASILLLIIAWVITRQNRTMPRSTPLRGATVSSERVIDELATQWGASVGEILAKSTIKPTDIVLSALIAGMVLGASIRARQRPPPSQEPVPRRVKM